MPFGRRPRLRGSLWTVGGTAGLTAAQHRVVDAGLGMCCEPHNALLESWRGQHRWHQSRHGFDGVEVGDVYDKGRVVLDTWRNLRQQQALRGHYRAEDEHVASTDPAAMQPPHATGAAVGLTLGYDGAALALGTGYDAFCDNARLNAFEHTPGTERSLRRLLSNVMLNAGLAACQPEWWRWSYGDDVWAAANTRPALYGLCAGPATSQPSNVGLADGRHRAEFSGVLGVCAKL